MKKKIQQETTITWYEKREISLPVHTLSINLQYLHTFVHQL